MFKVKAEEEKDQEEGNYDRVTQTESSRKTSRGGMEGIKKTR